MWQYYKDVTKFALAFYIVSLIFLSFQTAALVFAVFGTFIGLIGYRQFHNKEYYTYYNLGFTKRKLITATFLFNLIVAVPLYGLSVLSNIFS